MMKKGFVFNAVYVLLINVMIKPVYLFGIDRNVQLIVGERYGLYYTFFSLAFILNILSDLGIQGFNLRFASQNPHLIQKNVQKFLGLKLWLGIMFFAVYFSIGSFSNYPQEEFLLFLLVGLMLWLNALLLFLRSNIASKGLYMLDSTLSALDKFIMIVVCGVFVVQDELRAQLTIELFALFQVMAYLVPIALATMVLMRQHVPLKPKANRLFSIAILRKSFPYALVILLMSVYARIDSVMLAWIDPSKEIAVNEYAKSFRILEALNMFGFLLSGLLLPMFSKIFKKDQIPNELFYTAQGLSIAIAIPLGLSSIYYSQNIMQLLYFDDATAEILKWHLMAFIINTISYVFGTLITAQGSIHKLNLLFLSGCVLNVGLNIWIIPNYGPVGTAWTTFLTQLFILAGQAYYAFKIIGLKFEISSWVRYLIFSILVFGIFVLVEHHVFLMWYVEYLLFIIFSMTLSLVTGVVKIRSTLLVLRSKFNV